MSTRLSTKPVPISTYAADLERARGEDVTAAATNDLNQESEKKVGVQIPTQKEAHGSAKAPTERPIPKKTTTPTPIPKAKETLKPINTASEAVQKVSAPHPKPVPKPQTPAPAPAPAPNKIPAFHELQKQANQTISKNKAAKPVSTATPKPKKKRAGIFSSLINSITNFFKGFKKSKEKAAVYSVPDAQTRKGVIQKATSKTGTVFTADSESLKERIRRRKAAEQKTDEHATYWTPNTNTGYALLESTDTESQTATPEPIQNVTVEHKKRTITTTVPSAETDTQPTEEPEPPVALTQPVQDQAATEPETQQPQERGEAIEQPQPAAEPVTTPAPTPTKKGSKTPFIQQDTNLLTLQVMGGLVAVFTVVISSILVFQAFTSKPEAAPAPVLTQAMISNATLQPIVITAENANALPELISESAASAPVGVVEFPVTGPDRVEVSPSYLFSLLSFDTLPILRQSITTAHFVNVNNSQPALLFTFTDKEAVQGSLLEWEYTMASDMAEIYTLPSTITGRFVDQRVNGIDTRILAEDGNTILIYSFIDEQTVLISPSRATFTQIADLYQN